MLRDILISFIVLLPLVIIKGENAVFEPDLVWVFLFCTLDVAKPPDDVFIYSGTRLFASSAPTLKALNSFKITNLAANTAAVDILVIAGYRIDTWGVF